MSVPLPPSLDHHNTAAATAASQPTSMNDNISLIDIISREGESRTWVDPPLLPQETELPSSKLQLHLPTQHLPMAYVQAFQDQCVNEKIIFLDSDNNTPPPPNNTICISLPEEPPTHDHIHTTVDDPISSLRNDEDVLVIITPEQRDPPVSSAFENLSYLALKQLCKDYGLNAKGKKVELIGRLQQWEQDQLAHHG